VKKQKQAELEINLSSSDSSKSLSTSQEIPLKINNAGKRPKQSSTDNSNKIREIKPEPIVSVPLVVSAKVTSKSTPNPEHSSKTKTKQFEPIAPRTNFVFNLGIIAFLALFAVILFFFIWKGKQ